MGVTANQSVSICAAAMLVMACSCKPTDPEKKLQPSTEAPDITRLKKGMLFSEFQSILGTAGHIMPQPSPVEAHYIFDLDSRFIVATVRTHPEPKVVKDFTVRKDDLKAEQRRVQRQKSMSRAVINPQPKAKSQIPNKGAKPRLRNPEPGDMYGLDQSRDLPVVRSLLPKVKKGMSVDEVVEILGTPGTVYHNGFTYHKLDQRGAGIMNSSEGEVDISTDGSRIRAINDLKNVQGLYGIGGSKRKTPPSR